jgi:hypothetical protein
MNQLSPQARRLLELARDADDPGALERARVGQLIASRVARGGALAATRGAAKASVQKLFAASLKPALIALGVGGALGGVGFVANQRGSAVPASRTESRALPAATHEATIAPTRVATSAGAPATAAPRETNLSRSLVNPEARPPAPPSAVDEAPLPKPESAHRAFSAEPTSSARGSETAKKDAGTQGHATHDASSFAPDAATTSSVDPLRAEADGLRAAQRALRDGQAQTALQLLATQDARFAGGLLVEERAAARVLSLCQAGLAERARTEAVQFAKRWPRSALLSRVRAGCLRE